MNIREGKLVLLEQLFRQCAQTEGANKLPDGSKFLSIETIANHFGWDIETTKKLIFEAISKRQIMYQEKGMIDNPRLQVKAFLRVL